MPVKRPDPSEPSRREEARRFGGGHGHGPTGQDAIERASEILGYDVKETKLIESDPELHARILERIENPGPPVPAEEVFGDLADVED